MAAPQRRYRVSISTRPVAPPARRQVLERQMPDGAAGRKAAGRRRGFAVVVVIPVLLMLGSVYLHTVSAGLTGRAASLEERLVQIRAEGERLEVRVAELSAADRIRPLAIEKLGMKDPGGDLEVYDADREDGTRYGGQKEGGKPR
jgi:sirohydrochlorin ferrochelatase